ncbi:uncharacterized protein LOC129739048 isoform X2 [Uranotaenia lowii]|uniref:uncharacterized protein LOC129739048 isoform X2 n=1 Tax=Uranotaenia lowii TaxID=190385 RepID=UPI0024799C30|nr:uncharacterized protein LOC129739048 isoform X2 [Uranotaenia lowii]
MVQRKNDQDKLVEECVLTADGRKFILSKAENTDCVLDNYKLCHFHNKDDFAVIAGIYKNRKNETNAKDFRNIRNNYGKDMISKDWVLANPILSEKHISCVRQLIKEGITPFPYKVAKALDPSIYRNIEFDSWSDKRREIKYRNWYCGGSCLQIGVKCMVRLDKKDDRPSICYIQDMQPNRGPCIVYIEEIAACRTVSFDQLQPLPIEQIKPFVTHKKSRKIDLLCQQTIQNHFHTHIQKRYSKTKDKSLSKIDNFESGDPTKINSYSKKSILLEDFNSMYNFQQVAPVDMIIMPVITKTIKLGKYDSDPQRDISCRSHPPEADDAVVDSMSPKFHDIVQSGYSPEASDLHNPIAPFAFYAQPPPFSIAAPIPYTYYGVPNPLLTIAGPLHEGSNEYMPNYSVCHSVLPNGNDLPYSSMSSIGVFIHTSQHHPSSRHTLLYGGQCKCGLNTTVGLFFTSVYG